MWFLTIRLVEAKPKQRNLAERNWGDLDLSLCSEMCTAAILQHDIIIIKNTHNSGIDWHQLPIWTISNIPVVTAVVFFLKAKHAKVKQLQRVLYPGIFPFISLAVSHCYMCHCYIGWRYFLLIYKPSEGVTCLHLFKRQRLAIVFHKNTISRVCRIGGFSWNLARRLFKHRETKILDISFVTGVKATGFGKLFDTKKYNQ